MAKYANAFSGVDTGEISSAIDKFTAELNNINYQNYEINTQAKYDNTFNDGFEKLNTEVKSMISLCNSCKSNIIDKIKTYQELYEKYSTAYDNYWSSYNSWKDKGSNGNPPTKPANANSSELEALENEIKNASF